MDNLIDASVPPYRLGTKIQKTKVAFIFNAGGIGDYIHWIGAIKYVIDSNPHLYGIIVAPSYFYDLADLFLSKHSDRFEVIEGINIEDNEKYKDSAIIVPNNKQFANACGFHLTHLGFIYYTQKNQIIDGYATLPTINGDEADISHFNLPQNYAVIPTEATSANRKMPAATINSVTEHLINRGITPVFIGKQDLAHDYKAQSPEGLKLKGVLDLREKTSLREAACIMARSRFVLGMDGGMLHLASCSLVTTVFVFSTVHPDYRLPNRRAGAQTIVLTPPESLTCRFCNTGSPSEQGMTYVVGHDFKNCLYKDNLCTQMIDGKTLIPTIDRILEEKNGNEI